MVNINLSGVPGLGDDLIDTARQSYGRLASGDGKLGNWNGWMNYPVSISPDEIHSINNTAEKIISESRAVVVIGIGGSYLGAKAAIDFLKSSFYNSTYKTTPDIYFAGNNLSGEYIRQIVTLVAPRNFSVIVISKSGKTLETSLTFRVFLNLLQAKYGEKASQHIYVITDPETGALREYIRKTGCSSFSIPENIGGRYSVLTAVGLLPMAVAGIDISAVLQGAASEMSAGPDAAISYAAARQSLYRSGKKIELLGCYNPSFRYIGEWWRQLFAESEGKNGQGLFPVYEELSTDLHSIGQYIQGGERILFETIITFEKSKQLMLVPQCKFGDGYDCLSGLDFSLISSASSKGVIAAHCAGGVPVMEVSLPPVSPETFGGLVYFFELSCAVSAVISGVNPFDQPGVEAYKHNFLPNLSQMLQDICQQLQ